MLQCNNFKNVVGPVQGDFTPKAAFPRPIECLGHLFPHGIPAGTGQAGIAVDGDRLRALAQDELCRGDQALYLLTAQALATRTERLFDALPAEEAATEPDPRLHRPVNMTI